MDEARPTLKELQMQWKAKLQEAERALERARDDVRTAEKELRGESVPSPDAHYAYQRALRAEAVALENYAKILTIVNDLVLHGKIPKQDA